MKKILLIHLLIIIFLMNAFSQNSDSLQKSPTCFMIARATPKSKTKNVSEIFCMGDKIKVHTKDNQIIKGHIDHLTRDSVITVDGTEIDIQTIKSITKTETGTATALLGGVMIVGGIGLIVHGSDPYRELGSGAGEAGLGIAMIGCGIFTLTYHSKFKLGSGDQMIFKD